MTEQYPGDSDESPMEHYGENDSPTADPNVREMVRRGLNYRMAKRSLDRMYNQLTKKEREAGISLIPITITHILDSFREDDCLIQYAYGRNKNKDILFNRIRYSELVVLESENSQYAASKLENISCVEKDKEFTDRQQWYNVAKKEKEIHKMACMQIEDRMKVKSGAVASEIAILNHLLNTSSIKFTGVNIFEDENYKSKKFSNPIGIVSYVFKQRDGSMKKGKFNINEFF